MNKPLGIGVVGCGDVSLKLYFPHIYELVQDGKASLNMVCDTVEARAERIKNQFGAKVACTDYRKVIDAPDVDVVVNLTPAHLHASIALQAIRNGKHVYSEKPLALSMEDADAIIEETAKHKVTVVCAPSLVLSSVVQQVRNLVQRGLIGKVCFARAHSSHGGAGMHAHYYDPSWYYSKENGGGPLFDMGVYAIQELLFTLGPAKRVTGFSGLAIPEREIALVWEEGFKPHKVKLDVHDNTMILLDWGDACYGVIDGSHCMLASKGPNREYYGSEGVINVNHWGGPFATADPAIELYLEGRENGARGWMAPLPSRIAQQPKRPWSGPNGVEHLIDCVTTGQKPLASAEMARHSLEIILAVYKAAETGQAQELRTTF